MLMAKHVGKRGDTLIEVMLAVGIFSMVAVAVVAVMSGGTSSAQTALETTLTREAIDAQAEALRFIQSSYIAEKDNTADASYAKLWRAITGNALDIKGGTKEYQESITQFSPNDCSNLYSSDNLKNQHAFFINTRVLGNDDPNPAFITAANDGNSEFFSSASTYPRLVYNGEGNLASDSSSSDPSKLYRAEGIYIVAVKDPDSTTIAGTNKSAYYDFYIRTCWYGTGDKTPSTISTVMRLYDPGVVNN